MKASIYAVVDTNVIVSAVMARSPKSPTVSVVNCIFDRVITPIYNDEILSEYREVLSRPKFNFEASEVNNIIATIRDFGVNMERTPFPYDMPDPKDRVFYEVSLTGDSYLVTGNIKHFPITPKVVTPAEMIAIIDRNSK